MIEQKLVKFRNYCLMDLDFYTHLRAVILTTNTERLNECDKYKTVPKKQSSMREGMTPKNHRYLSVYNKFQRERKTLWKTQN